MDTSVDQVTIGIDSWIIQDGNYEDFAVGDLCRFALEFSGNDLKPSASSNGAKALHIGKSLYRVCAEILFVDPTVWVIDFGLRAFYESEPPHFALQGSWVEGEICVGIDPFFYMEYLHALPGMPKLFYEWEILNISRDDTPWVIEVNDRGGKTFHRDRTQERWTRVMRTDAWNDDEGRSSYVIEAQPRNV